MRLSLQSYFDLGFSLGLGDGVFCAASDGRVPDIAKVGISNPFGQGLVVDLCENDSIILQRWKEMALEKVVHPDTETGYARKPGISDEEDELHKTKFLEQLATSIVEHAFDRCTLTIYAVGLVFLRLDHAPGIPPEFLQGFHKCYEFAAYTVEISQALHELAVTTAQAKLGPSPNPLVELSKRPEPEIVTDENGYQESKLFLSFSCIALCVDVNDNVAQVKTACRAMEGGDFKELVFDYHGKMHFGWAVCILEPRTRDQPSELAFSEIHRMLECIQIAHVFLGLCQAFENLFLQETRTQVDGYVKGTRGRTSTELNRLRTLALAVVTLTQYAGVAEAIEDQRYFACWEESAKLKDRHTKIQQQCELLYNVQAAETQVEAAEIQAEEAKRERLLNRIVLILTAGTLISVLVDSYQFIDYKQGWFAVWINRALALIIVMLLVVIALMLVFRTIGRSKRE